MAGSGAASGSGSSNPGFGKPKRVRNSEGERNRASGWEARGMEREVGIIPVEFSSAGSRTSIRIWEGEGVIWMLRVLLVGLERYG